MMLDGSSWNPLRGTHTSLSLPLPAAPGPGLAPRRFQPIFALFLCGFFVVALESNRHHHHQMIRLITTSHLGLIISQSVRVRPNRPTSIHPILVIL